MLTLTIGTVKWNEIMMKKMGDPPKSSKFLVFNGQSQALRDPMNRGIASGARFRLSFIRFIATFYLEMQFQLEVYIQNYHRWVV